MIDAETVVLLIALGLILIWLIRKIFWEVKHHSMVKLEVEEGDDWSKIPTELFERLFSDITKEANRRGITASEPTYKTKYQAYTSRELTAMVCDIDDELRGRGYIDDSEKVIEP